MIDLNNLLERNTKMSEIIYLKKDDEVCLSSDSLITKLAYNRFTNSTYFTGETEYKPKVFYNKEKKIIWSLAGETSLYEDIKNCINRCLIDNPEFFAREMHTLYNAIVEYYQKSTVNDSFVNCHLFIVVNIQNINYTLSIYTSSIPKDNSINFFDTNKNLILLAGSYVNDDLNINIYNVDSNVNVINHSLDLINKISKQDYYKPKFEYPSVGGNVYSILMDNKGNIKTYINGEEKDF